VAVSRSRPVRRVWVHLAAVLGGLVLVVTPPLRHGSCWQRQARR
jgi:hypothetical protein